MRPQNQGKVEEDEPQERNAPVPCAGPAVPGLGSPWRARVEEQERQSREKKVQERKRRQKVPRLGAGEKAARAGTAQVSCATPASDRGWAHTTGFS